MLTENGEGLSIRQLFTIPLFWVALVLMVCAGASEISMAQWASAYVESALGISKSLGDIAGPCLFAVMMGISRSFYGKYGDRLDLMKFMICSGALCLVCYLLSALAPFPLQSLTVLTVSVHWQETPFCQKSCSQITSWIVQLSF